MWPFKEKEIVIDLDLTKKLDEPNPVIDMHKFNDAPRYKIGPPILDTGVKFYPVFEKTERWPLYWVDIRGVVKVTAEYTNLVEYFQTKEEAEQFIAGKD